MDQATPEEIAALHEEFGDRPPPHEVRRERRGLAWLIVAPWCLAAAMRLLALDNGYPLVQLFAFTPFVALTSVVPLAVALFLRVRRAAVAAVVALAVFAVLFAGRALPGPQPAANGRELTVMTFNTRVGGGDTQTVIQLVRSHQVDVLALQEVTPQIVELLREDGLTQALPYGLLDSRPGPLGGGVWSRLPLTRTYSETRPKLSQAPEGSIADFGVRVRSVHPVTPTSGGRVDSWRTALSTLPDPATEDGTLRVLAGDFNATLDHKALRGVIDRGYTDAADAVGKGLVSTWPADVKFALTLDHVLVDKHIRVLRVTTVRVPGSDHRAVIVRMRLP